MTTKGTVVATMVATMFASAPMAAVAADKGGGDRKVHCSGVNDCKGKGMCHSATSSCKGENSCKGKGWIETTEKECKDKHGTVVADK